MGFFDDFEKYIKDSLKPGTDAHDMEEFERSEYEERREHNEWLRKFHAEPGDPDYDEFESATSVEEFIDLHSHEMSDEEIDELRYEYGLPDEAVDERRAEYGLPEDNARNNITLTFSLGSPDEEKKIIEAGLFKYCDEGFRSWNIKEALFDKFPDLKAKYLAKKFESYEYDRVIREEYDKERNCAEVLTYLDWLIQNFPFQKAIEIDTYHGEKITSEISMELLGGMVYDSISRNFNKKNIEILYDYYKDNQKLFDIIFGTKWTKVDIHDVFDYFRIFLYKQDNDSIKKAFEAMTLDKTFFANDYERDEFLVTLISCSESFERDRQGGSCYSGSLDDDDYDFFMELLKPYKDTVPKARAELKDHAPEDSVDALVSQLEDIESDIEGLLYKKQQLIKRIAKRQKR